MGKNESKITPSNKCRLLKNEMKNPSVENVMLLANKGNILKITLASNDKILKISLASKGNLLKIIIENR